MKAIMLGCGSSAGVPLIGCNCKVCISNHPKNRRLRVSLFIEINGKNILIDTSPDLRQQALANGITCIDAVLYTHAHADHIHGIDDLRSFNYLARGSIPLYGDSETMKRITNSFAYAFQPKPDNLWYRPCLVPHVLPSAAVGSIDLFGNPVVYFEQLHGKTKTLGFRIGNLAYSTDTDGMPETAYEALAGVEVWIVDCLRYSDSHSHSSLKRTLEWIDRVKPRLAVLTHMAHDFDYDTLAKELPPGVVPGYDGLAIEL